MEQPYTPDPFKNFTPRQNPQKAVVVAEIKTDTLTAEELGLDDLENMPRKELKALLQRVIQAGWGYGKLTGKDLMQMALQTKEEAYEALKLTALTLAVNASDWREFNALATFWAEREKGKPKQSIDATVTIGVVEIVEEIAKRRKQQMIDVSPQS